MLEFLKLAGCLRFKPSKPPSSFSPHHQRNVMGFDENYVTLVMRTFLNPPQS